MLKDWIKEDRRFLEWRQDIARPSASGWRPSLTAMRVLLRGGPLSTAERWLSERPELSPEEHKFIAASVGLRERQREEDEARRRKDAEVARNLKWRAGILLGALLLAIGAFFFAVLYQSVRQGDLLGSVSAYYYTPAQAFFVGGLIGLGACMIALKGTNPVEDVFLNLGGVFAVIVALVPTGRKLITGRRSAPARRRALRCSPSWTAPRSRHWPTPPERTWTTTCSPSSPWAPSLSSPAWSLHGGTGR